MRFVCLVWLAWSAMAADRLADVRQRGAALEADGQWAKASAIYRSALDGLEPAASSQDRFWLLTSLAEVAFERKDYAESRRWLQQADVAAISLDANTPERVRLLNAWGTLHLVEGNLTAAERNLSRAVAVAESLKREPELAAALHNLAAVEMHTGQFPAAVEHQARALEIWRRLFGERNHYVMKAWVGLSSLQGLMGNWPEAAESLESALAIAPTSEALANYAVVLDKLKRGKEAKEIRRRLLVPAPPPAPLVDVRAMPGDASQPSLRTR